MPGMRGCRMQGAVLGPVAPYGDVDAVEVIVGPHPYLYCGCGFPLWHGVTTLGATVFVCNACERILDARRVA